jgi:hypothetical protein
LNRAEPLPQVYHEFRKLATAKLASHDHTLLVQRYMKIEM